MFKGFSMKENNKINHKDKFTYKKGDLIFVNKNIKEHNILSFSQFIVEKNVKFDDATMRWITIHDENNKQQHILIKKKDGTVLGGMGGIHNGEKISNVFQDLEHKEEKPPQKKILNPEETKKYIEDFKAQSASSSDFHKEMSIGDKDVNIDEKKSIQAYASNCYLTMNRLLRNPDYYDKQYPNDLSSDDRKIYESYITNCHNALKNNKSTKSVVAYRGVDYTLTKTFSKLNPGDEFIDEGFVSTSTTKDIAENFSGGGYVMTILIPKGSQAASIKYLARHAKENEILINKKARFEIKEINHDTKRMTIELLPHEDE